MCTHCHEACVVPRKAMSIFCPHCRKRLILENYKIKTYKSVRELATCGDVVVEKKGRVRALIKVGTLTVKGIVQGCVSARGAVTICKTGSLDGDIEAAALCVESGASLHGYLRIGPSPRVPSPRDSPPSLD